MKKTFSTRILVMISLLATLTYVAHYLRIPIGPVPFTLQTIIVIITGFILPPLAASITQLLNLFLMVFFHGAIASPTFGYLIGFVMAACVISSINQTTRFGKWTPLLAILCGEIMIYVIGVPYLAWASVNTTIDWLELISIGFLPFIIPDTVKAIIAYIMIRRLKHIQLSY